MRTILHCDANNFYASVECALNPGLKDKYVAVSGDPEKRHGIILAKNTAAKACGVKTGETIWQAKQKCPQLICVPPHFDMYVEYSRRIFAIYTQYTQRVEPFGIDECWLDVTHSSVFGSGVEIAPSNAAYNPAFRPPKIAPDDSPEFRSSAAMATTPAVNTRKVR